MGWSVRLGSGSLIRKWRRGEIGSDAMKTLIAAIVLLGVWGEAHAEHWGGELERYLVALHMREASGRLRPPAGDGGRSIGPLQIQRGYFEDSWVAGRWREVCMDLEGSRRVVVAYARRYEPRALREGRWSELAGLHNGGPGWRGKRGVIGRRIVAYRGDVVRIMKGGR